MYEWLKVLHIISFVSWFAGLFYLPRLFVYHSENPSHEHTCKTLEVMEYKLLKYIMKTPAGGTVLDPFTGSGSTGKAALLDGFQFVGAELTEEYLPIIEGRLRWASEQVEDEDVTLF